MEEGLEKELHLFMQKYEEATNSHDFTNVRPLIADDAVYFFSERNLYGIEEIERAFTETFNTILNETYSIKNITWIAVREGIAVCTYDFHWVGEVNDRKKEGSGRGTNVVVKENDTWLMKHEHLSTPNS